MESHRLPNGHVQPVFKESYYSVKELDSDEESEVKVGATRVNGHDGFIDQLDSTPEAENGIIDAESSDDENDDDWEVSSLYREIPSTLSDDDLMLCGNAPLDHPRRELS